MKLLKRFGIVILVILVSLQFLPTRINQSTVVLPTDFMKTYKVPSDIERILSVSCYNCHSNNTSYPWYSDVQPISWFLENHIKKGKDELNFSEFGAYSIRKKRSKLKSMISQIDNGDMPLASYTFIHRDARLSQDEKKRVVNYLKSVQDNLR